MVSTQIFTFLLLISSILICAVLSMECSHEKPTTGDLVCDVGVCRPCNVTCGSHGHFGWRASCDKNVQNGVTQESCECVNGAALGGSISKILVMGSIFLVVVMWNGRRNWFWKKCFGDISLISLVSFIVRLKRIFYFYVTVI